MHRLKKILVLEGGFNEEHKISLNTAKEVKKVLKKEKIFFKTLLVNPKKFENDIKKFSRDYICFNALHGTFGEDGTIQNILKKNNFRFTHSSILSSKKSFNKSLSKNIIRKIKIPTPDFFEININNLNNFLLLEAKKKYKSFVIKPNNSGSSFATNIVKDNNDLLFFIRNLNKYKKKLKNHSILIIEKFIFGKELTVSVLKKNSKNTPLGVTEIQSNNKFFDYQSKYTKGYSKHILPAKINKIQFNKCLNYAVKIHQKLNCNAISRSDFIYNNKEKKIYFLEINTQPGLTPISLVPEQARFKEITFADIVLELINNSK